MKPWMTDKQIELIQQYLKINHIMLEYGCGGSTLYFSKYVKTYVSIEHDSEWIKKIQNMIDHKTNIELYYCAPNNPIKLPVWTGCPVDFKDYINYIDTIQYKYYDIVLIDGRARQYCAKKVLNYVDKDSIIFVHDFFERERYYTIKQYYCIIDKDDTTIPSLVVLSKI